jgi:hypothetical protein
MLDAHFTRRRAFKCWQSLVEEVPHNPNLVWG